MANRNATDNFCANGKVGRATISILDDYALMAVFDKLDPKDLLRTQRVCRRWKAVAERCWASKTVLQFSGGEPERKRVMNDAMLHGILDLCGRNLRVMDLSAVACFLSDKSIRRIAKVCTNLEVLNLSRSNATTVRVRVADMAPQRDGSYQRIGQQCSRLTELTLDGCTGLTDVGLGEICSGCSELRKLSICGRGFSHLSNLDGIGELTQLRELRLARNSRVDDSSLFTIGKGCPQLEVLDLFACGRKVSDASLPSFRKCRNLRSLDISHLKKVTDNTLFALAEAGRLEEVRTQGNQDVTSEGCQELLALCPRLRLLDASGCRYVSRSVLHSCLRAVEARTDGPQLVVVVGGSGINLVARDSDDFAHPLLRFDTKDRRIAHREAEELRKVSNQEAGLVVTDIVLDDSDDDGRSSSCTSSSDWDEAISDDDLRFLAEAEA